jgi:hypothetical protein
MKRFYEKCRGENPGYKPGDNIYLSGKNLMTHQPMKKLDDKHHGPFKVVQKVGTPSYKLRFTPSSTPCSFVCRLNTRRSHHLCCQT